jgi:hypothetical protein
MKNFRSLAFALGFLMIVAESAAQPAAHYLTQMPANLIPSVSLEMRKDLIDFIQNGKTAVMPSIFGGQVTLKELSESYALLQTSDKASLQLKVLRIDDSTRILAVVHTVAAPLRDSRVQFYTTFWKPFSGMQMPVFQAVDFIDMEKAKTLGLMDKITDLSPRLFVSLRFQAENNGFWAYSSLKEDSQPEVSKLFESVLRDSVQYTLHADRFLKQ